MSRVSLLIAAAAATVVLWRVPGGNYVLYPFTILATWFHEMAHGLTALLLGGGFTRFVLFADGSGMAYYTGPLLFGRFGEALTAASGGLGPPVAGAALILASRTPRATSVALYLLGGFLLLSAVLWIRSLFGLLAISSLGILVLAATRRASSDLRSFAVQFLGVQACVSTYMQLGYLFSYSAGPSGLSDTGRIQQVLILPYWFWGALIAVLSFAILFWSLRSAFRARAST